MAISSFGSLSSRNKQHCRCLGGHWEDPRLRLEAAIALPKSHDAFVQKLPQACNAVRRLLHPHDFWGVTASLKDISTGNRQRADAIVRRMKHRFASDCLVGFAVGAYACTLVASLNDDDDGLRKILNIALVVMMHVADCLQPLGGKNWWPISAGRALRNMLAMHHSGTNFSMVHDALPICFEDLDHPQDSLFGYCGHRRAPHEVNLAAAGPLEALDKEDVVLCTHTSQELLSLVETMLLSWRGPASVSVLRNSSSDDALPALQAWLDHMAVQNVRQVIVSLVQSDGSANTEYDQVYPANVLRQAAVDAIASDLVLLADPGFTPSSGFRNLTHAAAPLGAAVRALSARTSTAFVVSSFVLLDEGTGNVDLAQLRRLVHAGSAVNFEMYVCRLCRPHSWQWTLLEDPSSLRFHEVGPADLHHPAWLIPRSLLPRLPAFLHGLVDPREKSAGWLGLPCGLRASAEQLLEQQVRLLLMPGVFLHRDQALPVPVAGRLTQKLLFDVAYRRFLASLNSTTIHTQGGLLPSSSQAVLCCGGRLAEVVPKSSTNAILLKEGSDSSLQLVVAASVILGMPGLQRFLDSVPWAVHAVAVASEDFWAEAKRQLPTLLRSFPRNAMVMVLDAYDMVLLPCDRSISDEYKALQKDIVISAERTCWPSAHLCLSCDKRYPAGSADRAACELFPNVNSGGYMGPAHALAEVFDWMRRQGDWIGIDDQENAWHYYLAHPDRVALDHQQRIWSTMDFTNNKNFQVVNCSVMSKYIRGQVCFAHGNGGSRHNILEPLLLELERRGCRQPTMERRASAYAGLSLALPVLN